MSLTPREFMEAIRPLHPEMTCSEADFDDSVRSLESDEGKEMLAVFRVIEALAHERGRQQGLKEVLGALREYPCATYQTEGMFAAIEAVKEHAAKGNANAH